MQVQIRETLNIKKRIKDRAIDLCENEAGKKRKESTGRNLFARKFHFCNSAQRVAFKLLAEQAKKSN